MRRRHGLYAAEALLGTLLMFPATGCSIALPGMVALSNRNLPRDEVIPADRALVVRPGARIVVIRGADSSLAGRFLETADVASRDYDPRYLAWREAHAPELPRPGEPVTLERAGRSPARGVFDGFGWHEVRFGQSGWSPARSVSFADFDSLRGPAGAVATSRLVALRLGGGLPTRSAFRVRLERRGGTVTVAADDVREVRLHYARHSVAGAAVIGVGVDVLILALVASSIEGPFDNAGGCESASIGVAALPEGLERAGAAFDPRTGRFLPAGGAGRPAFAAPRP